MSIGRKRRRMARICARLCRPDGLHTPCMRGYAASRIRRAKSAIAEALMRKSKTFIKTVLCFVGSVVRFLCPCRGLSWPF